MTAPAETARKGRLARASARALLDGFRAGRFTPADALEEVIAALGTVNDACNVIVTPMLESARAEAARATEAWRRGAASGALAGVPVTVKDLVYVAGVPAQAGAPMLKGFVPDQDAALVTWLKEAGAVLTCKTTTCESGYKLTADSPLTGIVRNPWRLDRTTGGSSGGAAAAVAAGAGPLAVGTDAVGSIRVPSSFCGVVGIKPTFGLVPRAPGFFPPSWGSLAHTGPIARTVADAALLLETLAGYDVRDPQSLPLARRRFEVAAGRLEGLRIAVSADLGMAQVAPEVRAAFERAVEHLADLGATIVEDHPGLDPDLLERTLRPIGYTEQATAIQGRCESDLARSDPDLRAVVKAGRHFSGVDYMAATHRRAQLRGRFVELFRRVDALATPTVPVTAFAAGTLGVDQIDGRPVDRHLGWSPFSWPMNLAGVPAASLPCGFDGEGLPIGFQIVCPWLEEPRLIRIAAALEAAQPWQDRWPGLGLGG
jgi:aspartyl-tRNA(Asn)/glutamyl-tRNA(Gln) amidotransferase subunit A